MATKQKGTYALLAILLLTVMSTGMSVNGYPAGGDQQGAGAVSYTHLRDH